MRMAILLMMMLSAAVDTPTRPILFDTRAPIEEVCRFEHRRAAFGDTATKGEEP